MYVGFSSEADSLRAKNGMDFFEVMKCSYLWIFPLMSSEVFLLAKRGIHRNKMRPGTWLRMLDAIVDKSEMID